MLHDVRNVKNTSKAALAGQLTREPVTAAPVTVDPVTIPPASGIPKRGGGRLTVAAGNLIGVAPGGGTIIPEFVRLPKTGTLCPHTGLTRSKMNELILPCPANNFKPPVQSVVLRQRGKIKGVRLISYFHLISYIRHQAAEQERSTAS